MSKEENSDLGAVCRSTEFNVSPIIKIPVAWESKITIKLKSVKRFKPQPF